jgi:hypothetical protein
VMSGVTTASSMVMPTAPAAVTLVAGQATALTVAMATMSQLLRHCHSRRCRRRHRSATSCRRLRQRDGLQRHPPWSTLRHQPPRHATPHDDCIVQPRHHNTTTTGDDKRR